MKRRLFTILSALSLLLFVAVVVLWVRSYDPGDFVRYYDPPSAYSFESSRGLFRITWGDLVAHYDSPTAGWDISLWSPEDVHYTFVADLGSGTLMGFGYEKRRFDTAEVQSVLTAPYWALAVASGIIPLVGTWRWLFNRRQVRRRAAGQCPSCGYDLRATPERCPECGSESVHA
jgi:hypothetical protein